jgi:benzoate/toluate 1,2-dioxygenase beta subunit
MKISYQDITNFVNKEVRHLDDRQWDEWLACYSESAVYWMPAWDDCDELTEDPQSEISLIYYPNREGLEDRVYRIRTERASSSMPEPRTTHFIANLEILSQTDNEVKIRYNWQTLSHRYKETTTFYGTAFCTLDTTAEQPLITDKKVVLNNDYINQVIDVYHL